MDRRDDPRAHTSGSFADREDPVPPDSRMLLAAVAAALDTLIPCDEVIWSSGRRARRQVVVLATARPHVPDGRGWRGLFGARAMRRQLTIPTTVDAATATVWSLNRYGADFSDDEVRLAGRLRPLLDVLECCEGWRPRGREAPAAGSPEPWSEGSGQGYWPTNGDTGAPKLTHRELEVLALLAQGLTAVSIGLRLRISSGTVRKHLEHIYEKTGYRDRLLAVEYAKRSGLLAQ
ncbi:MAG TPA: helix-turn-helix transcriptional regulator [Propionicimonas sp.]|jgi:DNA-binding CsgD family transcriptional regulator